MHLQPAICGMSNDLVQADKAVRIGFHASLFQQFPRSSVGHCLAWFNLAARKRPNSFLASCKQHLAVAPHASRCRKDGELARARHFSMLKVMCGLYSFRRSPEETRQLFAYAEMPDFPPRQFVTPGSPIAIVRQTRFAGESARHFALVRWGFIPGWVKEPKPGRPLINARAETVLDKPSYRNAMRRRRCLIPADGFYEWQGDIPGKKRPFFIHHKGDGLFAFAGIWENWMGADGSELDTAAIITTTPNAEISKIHDRSPAIIQPQDFEQWLDCENVAAEEAAELLRPPPDGFFMLEPTIIQRRPPPSKPAANPPPKPDQMKLI